MNALNTHDTPRFKSFTLTGAQKVAAGLQFTFPGIPVLWAGDEFGLDGDIGEKSRTPIPWNGERPSDPSMISVYSALAALRKKYAVLVSGSLRFVHADAETLIFERRNGKQSMLILATRGSVSKLALPLDAIAGLEKAKLVYGEAAIKLGKNKAKFSAEKMAFAVWHLPATSQR